MPQITKNLRLILITVSMFLWSCAAAEQVTFSDSWNEQTFSLFSSNEFELNGDTLEISSDGTVSILWKILPSVMWGANQANWD